MGLNFSRNRYLRATKIFDRLGDNNSQCDDRNQDMTNIGLDRNLTNGFTACFGFDIYRLPQTPKISGSVYLNRRGIIGIILGYNPQIGT